MKSNRIQQRLFLLHVNDYSSFSFNHSILCKFFSAPIQTEAKAEISLNDRTLTILSTASLPARTTTSDDFPSSSIIAKDTQVQTLSPRRRQTPTGNEIIYQLYRQRLTNRSPNATKRSSAKAMENSNAKRSKPSQQPEIIVLD